MNSDSFDPAAQEQWQQQQAVEPGAPESPSRREFLGTTGATVAASTVVSFATPAMAQSADAAAPRTAITVSVNGVQHEVEVEDRWTLAELLRDGIGLTGAKIGCDRSECGACTVLMNGAPVYSCSQLAVQADGNGRLDTSGFPGFARAETGEAADDSYTFRTVKPGPLGKDEAPYICMIVFMRGMLLHACTRIYFADEAANSNDPVFSRLPEGHRETLLARRVEMAHAIRYEFDIHMQGEREIVFFIL